MSDSKAISHSIRVVIFDGTAEIFSKSFEHKTVTFGRSPKMDIPLEFDFISRAHGNLSYENGTWYLNDLKSSNGTFINGARISRVPIKGHIKFQVGRLFIIATTNSLSHEIDPDDEITSPTIIPEKAVTANAPISATAATIPIQSPKKLPATASKNVALAKTELVTAVAPAHTPKSPPPLHVEYSPTSERVPVIDRDFSPELLGVHAGAHSSPRRKLEGVVTWHGQVYDVKEFNSGDTITAGPVGYSSLNVPTLKDPLVIARVGNDRVQCLVPQGGQVSLDRSNQTLAMGDLISSKFVQQTSFGYSLKIDFQDAAHIDLGSGMAVHFRYVPMSQPLPNWKGSESENIFKQSIMSSFALHGALLLIILLTAPPVVHGPKLKNVPDRFARLLVEKPKPKPTPVPTPPPKPQEKKKEIVKKPPPTPKKPEKVVQKIMKPPKVIEKVNKFPIVVQKPVPKAPPPVKVENLGALAALGAISSKPQPNVVTNININKNAGGLPTKSINTGGIVGALPSTNGVLLAGGGPRVKTKGMGFGTGTGYGVQGLKGTAGGRSVAGAIVGEPKLAKSGKVEGLTRAQVMSVVQKYLGEVQHCYERNLLSNPNLAGRMEFEWDIASSGSVTSVRVKRTTVNNGDSLGECVKSLFSSMKFPRATNGQTTTPSIGFPFGRL